MVWGFACCSVTNRDEVGLHVRVLSIICCMIKPIIVLNGNSSSKPKGAHFNRSWFTLASLCGTHSHTIQLLYKVIQLGQIHKANLLWYTNSLYGTTTYYKRRGWCREVNRIISGFEHKWFIIRIVITYCSKTDIKVLWEKNRVRIHPTCIIAKWVVGYNINSIIIMRINYQHNNNNYVSVCLASTTTLMQLLKTLASTWELYESKFMLRSQLLMSDGCGKHEAHFECTKMCGVR